MMPVGNPAIGEDFFDREQEIKQILLALKKDNVLLAAPRRFGKTSIMRRLEKELFGGDNVVIFLDVESVYSPQEFLSEIIMGLTDVKILNNKSGIFSKIKKLFKIVQDNVEEIGVSAVFKAKLRRSIEEGLKENWTDKSNAVFHIINTSDVNLHFIFDEFPIAIKNMDESDARMFLLWFRKVRQTCTNVRFIVGGSVSVERVLRDVGGDSVINDFKKIRVDGFNRDVTLQLIQKVFKNMDWEYTLSAGNKILDCVGESYIPYFVAIMLSAISDEQITTGREVNDILIEDVYNSRILGSKCKNYFDPYFNRLKMFYDKMDEKAARAILGKVSCVENYPLALAFDIFQKETGSQDREHFLDLISDLENDFYINSNGGQLNFYSKILKDWWRIFHGNF